MKEAELAKITRQLLGYSGLVHWRVSNGAVMHRIGPRIIMKKSEIAGFPDWAGVTRNGTFWALELKSEKGRISEHQIEWMEKLAGTHAIVAIARTVEDVMEFIFLIGGKVKKIN
jgi:hypothetical protein